MSRPSVALVVIFGFESPTLEGKPSSWSSLIWHEREGFPSNVGLSKPKMTTSATLGLGKNCPYIKYFHLTINGREKVIDLY